MKFIAKTQEGLEGVLAEELLQIGAEDILILKRAVSYTGDTALLYKSNLLLRTALKILVFVNEFTIKDDKDLYTEIKNFPWEEYFNVDDTFAIDSVVNSTIFRHSNFIALKVKDAIVDRFREKNGTRPNVNVENPTLRINIHIREDIVTLSLDSSGQSLHMRGYRKRTVEAPLNEVMAAGLLLLSGWDSSTPLIDPMCGSGTLLCEAAKMSMNIPPQDVSRDFAFKTWKTYDPILWQQICDEAISRQKNICPPIKGYDISHKALEASTYNTIAAGLESFITYEEGDFFFSDGATDCTLICNPPYDARLKEDDVMDFYKFIGDKLKNSYKGCTAWVLSGNLPAIKNVGLRPSAKKSLLNGSIPSYFCKFEMYDGSKKAKYQHYKNDTPNASDSL